MEYSRIIAITGLPGLFELISSKSDGGIVRSLEDKSTRFVSSRVHQFSHLESIEVYTTQHNVNLVDVLKAMETSKEKLPDDKDGAGLKAYFTKVFPELDQERVYTSDLKKMVKWFIMLSKNQVEIKLSEPDPEEVEEVEEVIEEKPVRKTTPAKAEVKPVEEKKPAKKPEKEKVEEKPVKKPAKKEAAEAPVKKAAAKKELPAKTGTKTASKPTAKKPPAKKK